LDTQDGIDEHMASMKKYGLSQVGMDGSEKRWFDEMTKPSVWGYCRWIN
jgi:hypothetical protein